MWILVFNTRSRTKNVLLTASVSEICTIFNQVLGFIYRTIFLYLLSSDYLGLNGLFTNILNILSLAELGISTVIVYRFYQPIKEQNIEQVGKLMNYFQHVYRIILCIILGSGLCLLPFLNFFINADSQIPADINLYVIYILFLMQTASSYLFAYRQSLLTADQKQYQLSIFQLVITVVRYTVQVMILFWFYDYTLTLLLSVAITILGNITISTIVKHKYKDVFKIKSSLKKDEKREILADTRACMCHRIGSTVLTSTDNLVLAKMINLFYVGVYSNYSLIINSLNTLASQVLDNVTASLGNAHVEMDENGRLQVYKNMIFVNWWMAVSLTVCLYSLINKLIIIWIGPEFLLNKFTVMCLAVQFYLTFSRKTNISFTNASGLFVKDMYRPLIEALLNLLISIFLAQKVGIAGVFLGTIISSLLTVFWREPYLLFIYDFKSGITWYWIEYIKFAILALFLSEIMGKITEIYVNGIVTWIIAGIIIFVITQFMLFLCFRKRKEFLYLRSICERIVKSIGGILRKIRYKVI